MRQTLPLVIGVVMIALGLIVAGRLLFMNAAPATGRVWLDALFAVFFVLRGAMNVATARRAAARSRGVPPAP